MAVDSAKTSVRPGHALPPALLVTLGVLTAFGPLSLDLYIPALPSLARDFGVAEGSAALTVSGCIIGLAVGQLVAGPLSDRLGRRLPLLVGVSAYVVASLLCAVAPTMWFLIVVRVLQGASGAAGTVIARATVRDLAPSHELARIFSLLMLVMGIAPIIAPVIGSGLIHLMPWRGLFVVLTGVGLVILFLTMRFVPESLPPERRHAGGLVAVFAAIRVLAHDRQFVGAALSLGLGVASMFSYISLSSFVFQDGFGLSPTEYGLIFATNAIGLMIGGRVNARLVRRFRTTALLGFGLTAMMLADGVLVIAGAAGWGLPVVWPCLLVAVSMTALLMPNATALGLVHHATSAGTASAVMGVMQYGTGALIGALASGSGTSLLTMATSMLIGAALALLAWVTLLRHAS